MCRQPVALLHLSPHLTYLIHCPGSLHKSVNQLNLSTFRLLLGGSTSYIIQTQRRPLTFAGKAATASPYGFVTPADVKMCAVLVDLGCADRDSRNGSRSSFQLVCLPVAMTASTIVCSEIGLHNSFKTSLSQKRDHAPNDSRIILANTTRLD